MPFHTIVLSYKLSPLSWHSWVCCPGGAEFAGPENGGPKKNKDWKMQDLENDGLGYSKVLRNAKEQVVIVCT